MYRFYDTFVPSKTVSKFAAILVVRADRIGDFILFSSTLRYIKDQYPGHKIFLICDFRIEPLLSKVDGVDRFIPLDGSRFRCNPVYYLKIFRIIRKLKFDHVINAEYGRGYISDSIVRIAKSDDKIGFRGFSRNSFYNRLVCVNEFIHEINKYILLLEALGVTNVDKHGLMPTIALNKEDLDRAEKILLDNGWTGNKYVVICPLSDSRVKNWPLDRFRSVIVFLINCGFDVVITGNKTHRVIYPPKKKLNGVVDIMGKTNLIDLAAILRRAVFYFGVDTSALHLAVAVGTPCIGIVGGGHFGRFFPYGDKMFNRCLYDKNMKCMQDNWQCVKGHFNEPAPCIEGISVESAIHEIKRLLTYLSVSDDRLEKHAQSFSHNTDI